MNSLLFNQKIKKRRSYGYAVSAGNYVSDLPRPDFSQRNKIKQNRSLSRERKSGKKAAFRPEGILSLFKQNSRFIDRVRQEPMRVHRHRQDFSAPRKISAAMNQDTRKQRTGRRNFSLALPVLPFCALLIFALGGFFFIQNQGGLDWVGREVVSSEKDPGSQYNMALYAGLNPAGYTGMNADQMAGENTAGAISGNEIPGSTIPLDMTETFAWQSYRVKRGDSVSKIASAFSVSIDAIIASNGITNVRTLKEGEVLRIPNMDGVPHIVKGGETLSGISKAKGVPLEAILDANDIQSDIITPGMTLFIPGARMNREDLKMALGELFLYPLRGARLTSPFGWRNDPITGVRRHHAAVDLSAPQGTVVKAAMDGKAQAVGYDRTYGNYVILGHPGGYQTMYAHLNTVTLKKGDQAGQGSQIGTVGNTGYSTGPHLHFAIFKSGRAVNPLDFLSPKR